MNKDTKFDLYSQPENLHLPNVLCRWFFFNAFLCDTLLITATMIMHDRTFVAVGQS